MSTWSSFGATPDLEYEEWGQSATKREYDYMLSYSPYDNVAQKSYPAMFVTAGLCDSQVSYAEPAKWVARLRASKADWRDLLLRTDMDSGHEGRSGRTDRPGKVREARAILGWLIALPIDCVEWRRGLAKSLWARTRG